MDRKLIICRRRRRRLRFSFFFFEFFFFFLLPLFIDGSSGRDALLIGRWISHPCVLICCSFLPISQWSLKNSELINMLPLLTITFTRITLLL